MWSVFREVYIHLLIRNHNQCTERAGNTLNGIIREVTTAMSEASRATATFLDALENLNEISRERKAELMQGFAAMETRLLAAIDRLQRSTSITNVHGGQNNIGETDIHGRQNQS